MESMEKAALLLEANKRSPKYKGENIGLVKNKLQFQLLVVM
jgi:hypothetical protein